MKEDQIQEAIIEYCKVKNIMVFAPILENNWSGIIRKMLIGSLGKAKGMQAANTIISRIVAKNKRMGQRAGTTDLVVALHGGKTIYIELKIQNGKLSEDQVTFAEDLAKRGHDAFICRSLDDFIEIIENFTKGIDIK